jgi:hypothetical protein
VEVVGWKYFVNEEKTRSFFTLTINSGKLQVRPLFCPQQSQFYRILSSLPEDNRVHRGGG